MTGPYGVMPVRLAVRLRHNASVYTVQHAIRLLSGSRSLLSGYLSGRCPAVGDGKPDRGTRLYRRSRPCPVARGLG